MNHWFNLSGKIFVDTDELRALAEERYPDLHKQTVAEGAEFFDEDILALLSPAQRTNLFEDIAKQKLSDIHSDVKVYEVTLS